MNQKRINDWIPTAIAVLNEIGINKKKDKDGNEVEIPVPKAFKGYFSAFGAAVVQSGMLPAVIFFENDTGRTEADRPQVIKAVFKLLKKKLLIPGTATNGLTAYLLESANRQKELQKPIVEAAIALKIALRTFKIEKDQSNESE